MTTNDKEQKLKLLMDGIELIKSGYAGVDRKGTILDRRTNQGLIACRKNEMLNTPEPNPVEGEFKEGSKDWLRARNRELNTEQDVIDKNMELFHLLKNNHKK